MTTPAVQHAVDTAFRAEWGRVAATGPSPERAAIPGGGRVLFRVQLPPPDQPGVREGVVRRDLSGYQLPALCCPVVQMVRDIRIVSRSFLAQVLIFGCHAWSVGREDGHVSRTGSTGYPPTNDERQSPPSVLREVAGVK